MAAISSLVVHDMAGPPKPAVEDVDTPTTPRAPKFPINRPPDHADHASDMVPSRLGQNAVTARSNDEPATSSRPGTSGSLAVSDPMDVDTPHKESDDGDEPGVDGDAYASARKKKGQRFFCTGYPPCNLSFTRSEHLARHIRKHTGERPFQCHCNRRFSRLDNLRQHAQTVHVNEDIPTDSLAATGTRFQRQIRTDRVRQGPGPRAGAMPGAGSHSRGHSRNLSASSIGSTSSNYSTVTEAKRRPPPLLLANDSSRPKLGLEPPRTPPAQYHALSQQSPGGGPATPTSATWSAAPGSPAFGSSTLGSPISSAARLVGYGDRTPGRRLSVPSGLSPYNQQPPPPFHFPMHAVPMGPPSSNSSALPSSFASPTVSQFSFASSHRSPPGEDWRRRTWHSSTFSGHGYHHSRSTSSGLTHSQTPDEFQQGFARTAPAAPVTPAAPAAPVAPVALAPPGQAQRLPGIESFDQVQYRPSTPPRRQLSPSHPASAHSQATATRLPNYPELDEPGHVVNSKSWAAAPSTTPTRAPNRPLGPPTEMGPPPPVPSTQQQQPPPPPQQQPQQQQQRLQSLQERPKIHSATQRAKRQGWYNVPPVGSRTSPEDSSSSDGISTPGTSAVEVHPIILPSSGFIEPPHAIIAPDSQQNACLGPTAHLQSAYDERSARERTTSFGERSAHSGDMNRLDALVAVATSGEATAAR